MDQIIQTQLDAGRFVTGEDGLLRVKPAEPKAPAESPPADDEGEPATEDVEPPAGPEV